MWITASILLPRWPPKRVGFVTRAVKVTILLDSKYWLEFKATARYPILTDILNKTPQFRSTEGSRTGLLVLYYLIWGPLPNFQQMWHVLVNAYQFVIKSLQAYLNLFELVHTYSNMFKFVQTCPNLSKLVNTCSNLFKFALTC